MPKQEKELTPLEKAQRTITTALDSVWVIDDTIEKITGGALPTEGRKSDIERNVSHLKIVIEYDTVKQSGLDLTAITEGIARGEQALENIEWQIEE